jgi:hypothetical protein
MIEQINPINFFRKYRVINRIGTIRIRFCWSCCDSEFGIWDDGALFGMIIFPFLELFIKNGRDFIRFNPLRIDTSWVLDLPEKKSPAINPVLYAPSAIPVVIPTLSSRQT